MPEVKDSEGNVVANLPYTDEGMEVAEEMKEANPNLDINYSPGGTSDAMSRSVTNYAGGGETGYNAIGAERPMYKEGGLTKWQKNQPKREKREKDKLTKKHEIAKAKLKHAKSKYQDQLDKELAKDIKKGREKGTTTKRRRKIAKAIQEGLSKGALAVGSGLATTGIVSGMASGNLAAGSKLAQKAVAPLLAGAAISGTVDKKDKATLLEPKLKRVQKLEKKAKKLKDKASK